MRDRRGGPYVEAVFSAARALRRRAAVAGAAAAAAAACALFLLATLLPDGAALGPPGFLVALVGVASAAAIVVGNARRARVELRAVSLAPEVEGALGLSDGELRAASELGRVKPGESEALARAHGESVARRLGGRTMRELLPRTEPRWRRRLIVAGTGAAVALAMVAVSALVRPSATARTARVWAMPWKVLASVPAPPLRIEAPESVPRGESAPVRVIARGRSRILLYEQVPGEPVRARDLEVEAASGLAEARSSPLQVVTRIWAEDGRGRLSNVVTVRPQDPLLLLGVSLVLRYPRYLGRPAEELRRPFPVLAIPDGTALELHGAANRELREAGLEVAVAGGSQSVRFALDGERFSGSFRPTVGGAWEWRLSAVEPAYGSVLPPALEIELHPDSLPEVRIIHPEGDAVLGGSLRLPLLIDVRDDVALSEVSIVSWRVSANGTADAPVVEAITPELPAARHILRPVLEVAERALLPGDTLYYFARARDAHPRHPPASSDTLRAFLPTLQHLREAAAAGVDSVADEAARLSEGMRELGRRAREAERMVRAGTADPTRGGISPAAPGGRGLSYEATREGRDALERAEGLGRDLEAMTDRLDELENLSEVLLDASLREELARLEQMYRDLLDSGLGESIQELREALQELRPEDLREALERLATSAARAREELERNAALLERAALEQGIRSARSAAEELAHRQQGLVEETEPDARWSGEESALAHAAEELSARVASLGDRLESSLAAAASTEVVDSLAQASSAAREAARAAEAAAEEAVRAGAAERGDRVDAPQDDAPARAETRAGAEAALGRARNGARSAAERLDEAASALSAAESALAREWSSEAAESLRRARREALALAREQSALTERSGGPAALDASALQGRQAALRSGLDNLLGSLAEAGRRTPLLDRETGRAAVDAARLMDDLLSRLQGQGASPRPTRSDGEAISRALNELAAKLLTSAEAVEAASSATGLEQALDQLASAARTQEGVSRESGSLMLLQQAGRPVAARVEALADRQEEVERSLRQLAEGTAPEELLVRPKELAREAGELARRLRSGGLSPETVERQERLFRRLLDAGRSLEKTDEDPDRRKSRPGVALPSEVAPLDPALLAGPGYPHPGEAELRHLPPAYRWMVLDYFDRLNRAAGPGGAGPDTRGRP